MTSQITNNCSKYIISLFIMIFAFAVTSNSYALSCNKNGDNLYYFIVVTDKTIQNASAHIGSSHIHVKNCPDGKRSCWGFTPKDGYNGVCLNPNKTTPTMKVTANGHSVVVNLTSPKLQLQPGQYYYVSVSTSWNDIWLFMPITCAMNQGSDISTAFCKGSDN